MLLRRLISYRSVDLIYGSHARQGLLSGISKLSQAVTLTLGPKGRHVALEYEIGRPKITKDGVTVAKYFGLPSSLEDLGARLVMTSAHEANEYAGDGTTTTTLLTYQMVKAGLELLAKGAHPIMVKRGIDAACAQAVDYLRSRTVPVTREEEILALAMVSTNHDKPLAQLIAKAVLKTGKTGLVTVEEGSTDENRLICSEGMVVNRGFSSPAFITDPGAADIRLESPLVLTLCGKITELTALLPVLEKVKASQHSLVIVAEDVDAATQSALLVNLKNKTVTTCLVLYPGIGWNRDMIEDISCFTAAKSFSKLQTESEEQLLKAELSDLGSARRVTIEENQSTWFGGAGNTKSRISELSRQLDIATMAEETSVLKERIKRLSGKMAVLEIGLKGGAVQMGETRDKVVDCLNAVKSGVEEGLLPGGGVAFLYASRHLVPPESQPELLSGFRVLKNALQVPFLTLLQHSGVGLYVLADLLEQSNEDLGVDILTGTVCDLIQAGIVDSARVTRQSLQTACSLAGMVLTTEAAVVRLRAYTPAPLQHYRKEAF